MPYVIDMQPARGASPSGRVYVAHRRYFRPGPPTPSRALGAGSAAEEQFAQILGGGASVASGIASAAGVTASVAAGTAGTLATVAATAIPIVGAVAALGVLLAMYIGGGCGNACIDSSKVEQIYEAAADNLYAVGQLGMITRDEAIAGMQALIQAGQQHEAQLNDKQAQSGIANLTKVINAEIADCQNLSDTPTTPINLTQAHSVYVSASGWYPDSLAAASQASDEYLSQLASARGANPSSPATSSLTSGSVSIAGVTLSPLVIVAGLGALLLVL